MKASLPHVSPITVRPASRDDFPAIAALLIQLYAVELPGALSRPHHRYQRLLEWMLETKQAQGLRERYVACSADGHVLATAALDRPDSVPYERAPRGTIRMSVSSLGYRSTARLLITVAQSMVGIQRPQMPEAVGLHSMVIDAGYRGQGIGRMIMRELEQRATDFGYEAVWLQVLAMNHPARYLYKRSGYTDVWSSPRWTSVVSWPSYIMRKSLLPRSDEMTLQRE